jgi:hypothetical protein
MIDEKTMDLRDWFAGQALNALVATERISPLGDSPFHHYHHGLAERAYEYAEQMMQEREKYHAKG